MAAITKKVPAKPLKGVAVGEINVAKDGNTVKLWIVLDGLVYETSMVQQSQAPSSGGSGGTTNHAALTNLDYASSGHTGFQASLGFTPAPASSSFVVISLDGSLTSERNLAVGASLSLADSGANAAVTLNTIQDIRTSASPTFASVVISPVTYGNVLSANGTAFVSLTPDAAGLVDKSSTQTGIAGNKTFTGATTFQTAVDSTTGFRVLDADGGTPIINVDTTNERFGIGTSSPANKMQIVGSADETHLSINGFSTQTSPFIRINNSVGTELLRLFVSSDALSVGFGRNCGNAITSAVQCFFLGADCGKQVTSGNGNTFIGAIAGSNITTGTANVAIGANALASATTALNNTAIGESALKNIPAAAAADGNVMIGRNSGVGFNSAVSNNTGIGYLSLFSNLAGIDNTCIGMSAGRSGTTGSQNVYIGKFSGNNATGSGNIYIGFQAGSAANSGSNNIIIGYNNANLSSSNNKQLNIGNLIYGTNVGIDGVAATGQVTIVAASSSTSSINNILTVGRNSTGTPATNFGCDILFTLESSTTENQSAIRIIAETVVATHASRTYRGRLTAYDYTAEREVLRWEADGSAGRFGAFGVTAVVRPTAYTQTYSTATKTHAARTAATLTDNSAGTANTTVEALPDPADTPATADALRDDIVTNLLPALRNNFADIVAQINALKADIDNTAQFANQMCDDHQGLGWLQ